MSTEKKEHSRTLGYWTGVLFIGIIAGTISGIVTGLFNWYVTETHSKEVKQMFNVFFENKAQSDSILLSHLDSLAGSGSNIGNDGTGSNTGNYGSSDTVK